jgi:Holliday junction resolvase
MVDSRAKGLRGEYFVRDMLRKHTGHQFERVPNSGALSYLKGDLYVPSGNNRFCIEVKNYADSPFSDKIFTQPKTNKLVQWWQKLCRQANSMDQEPLLFYKYNRSKVYVCTALPPSNVEEFIHLTWLGCYLMLAESWLEKENVEFLDA